MSNSSCAWAGTASWVRKRVVQSRDGGTSELALLLKEMPSPPSPWGAFPSSPLWFRRIKLIAANRDFFP